MGASRSSSIAALATAATVLAAVPAFAAPSRPARTRQPPSQAEIIKVIDEHFDSIIKVCYRRGPPDYDNAIPGRIAVKLTIGISGRVKHVIIIDGRSRFGIRLEPCIREAVSHWIFQKASEEYGTEFHVVSRNGYDIDFPEGCSITVDTVPWSEVWVDGQNTTRHTPLADFGLRCGKHKLTFKRPDMKIDWTDSINLRLGEKFMQRYTLTNDD